MQIISDFTSRVPIELSSPTQAGSTKDNKDLSRAGVHDRTTFSDVSATVESLKKTLEGFADVRSEKIDALRECMMAGTYSVSPKRIAAAMHREVTGA